MGSNWAEIEQDTVEQFFSNHEIAIRKGCRTILTNGKGPHHQKLVLPMDPAHLDGSNETSLT